VTGPREVAAVVAALALCPIAALLIGTDAAEPVARGLAVIGLERDLGIFVEPTVHHWTAAHEPLMTAASWFYVWAHVPVAGWALVWTWFLRRDVYPRVRNTFLYAQALTVLLWVVAPTAPPRLTDPDEFADTLAGTWGQGFADSSHLVQSPYAAFPSGHVAFALIAGVTFARLGDQRWLRVFGCIYPPVVVLVTVATANHYVLDAIGAVAVVAAAAKLSTVRAWPRSKRTSPEPSGRSRSRSATPSRRATRS